MKGGTTAARSIPRLQYLGGLIWPVAASFLVWPHAYASAQGVASSGIRGTVVADGSPAIEAAQVRITHTRTGFSAEVRTHRGRFFIQGLEPGGPYAVIVRRLGFVQQKRDGIYLKLGEMRELEFALLPQTIELDTVKVVAGTRVNSSDQPGGGTGMTIRDPLLHSLPTLNRDFYDFVRLVPQVSTKIGLPNAGMSAGGVGMRFNNYLINGVSERTLSGNVSTAFSGAKSVPLDAVKEYQVLVAPYDVRFGDFTGALVNAVTSSGDNTFSGSMFAYARNDRLGRHTEATGYDRAQYGVSVGGPIVRDRLHFFVASEMQHFTYPSSGPYLGGPQTGDGAVPVREEDLDRLSEIMRQYNLVAGSAGPVQNGNPLWNIFARLDLALPKANSHVVAWTNQSNSDEGLFSRASSRDTFSLSTYKLTRGSASRLGAIQVHTTLSRAGGGHNELLISHRTQKATSISDVYQPIVRVSVPSVSGGRLTLNSGTHETAQGVGTAASDLGLRNNLTLPVGLSHVLTIGAEADWFRISKGGVPGSYGTWTFASLDDLELGVAERYELGVDFGSASVPIHGAQYAVYLGDQWRPHRRVSVTGGLRADLLALDGHAVYHSGVDSIFSRRTDRMPRPRAEFSPRLGFVWDFSEARQRRIRGGAGIFTTRYPLAWAHTALSSNGAGGGLLRCGRVPGDLGLPPSFNRDYRLPPTTCANDSSVVASRRGDVDLLASNLRMMRTVRASLAYDASLALGVRFTSEVLLTRGLSDFTFVNLNLQEPATVDRNGRTMYGAIGQSGAAIPNLKSGFSEVIDLRNSSGGRSFQVATRLARELGDHANGMLSYTYSHVRDAMTPLRVNTRGTVAWSSARVLSGRDDDLAPGISSNDIPHRFVLAGSYTFPRQRWPTDVSFYYLGESGRPFTYTSFGTSRRGDLNADGSSANDPIYVPESALDPNEVRFDGDAGSVMTQQTEFEALIARAPCLRRQRGRIMARNSCREPWSSTTFASARQAIPVAAHRMEAQLDVFNVLNLVSGNWGLRREAIPALLNHISQTAGPPQTSQSIFRFDSAAPRWSTQPVESAFQLQLSLRYRF